MKDTGTDVPTNRRTRVLVGWALAALTTIVALVNQREVGIARDEATYIRAGARYAEWWRGFVTFKHGAGEAGITSVFGGPNGGGNNPEHPPLVKTLVGLSGWLFHDKLGVDELTADRIPNAMFDGLLVVLVYFMLLAIWGFPEAVLAGLLVLLLPRALFHASIACFDGPITTLWFATVYAYWRALDGRNWPWQVGVVFGLALATKHNAVLLPFALIIHYIVVAIYEAPRPLRVMDIVRFRWRIAVSLIVVSPLVLIAAWPWLWLDPIGHIRSWLTFHATHVHYNFEYLGTNWNHPRFPWHVALVTTLFTVPVATLVAAIPGIGLWIKHRWEVEHAPALLLVLSSIASIGPFFLGTTPIFGAEKHWGPSIPTLCIAGAVGAVWAAREAARAFPRIREQVAIAIVAAAIVAAGTVETVTAEPYALTWYNALAGGAPGGADLGMNRQFWGVAARGVTDVIATQPKGPVYTHDASLAWGFYEKFGLVPPGNRDPGEHPTGDGTWIAPGVTGSRTAIVIHEKHFNRHDYLIWKAYGTVRPIAVLRSDGVPIVSVYARPDAAQRP